MILDLTSCPLCPLGPLSPLDPLVPSSPLIFCNVLFFGIKHLKKSSCTSCNGKYSKDLLKHTGKPGYPGKPGFPCERAKFIALHCNMKIIFKI